MTTTPDSGKIDPVLLMAPPAELGALRDRGARRRHLTATVVDLSARGHLRILDAGNDPAIGEALDWLLLLPGERASTSSDPDDTRLTASPSAGEPPQRGSGEAVAAEPSTDYLRHHEQAVLDLIAGTPTRLLSRVRASEDITAVLDALANDAARRGWLRSVAGIRTRTAAGRAVHVELAAARTRLESGRCPAALTAALLPQAVALGLGQVWAARLGQQRPPLPSWFTPGSSMPARGWLGLSSAVLALAVPAPPGGGAGSSMSTPPGAGSGGGLYGP